MLYVVKVFNFLFLTGCNRTYNVNRNISSTLTIDVIYVVKNFNFLFLTGCNRTYNGNSGQIYSPGWPGNYPVDSYCEMTVISSPGTSLSLYFNSFQIEAHRSCQYDGLLVRFITRILMCKNC